MFTFDYNGNILTQQRYEGSTLVDSLTYQYATNSAGHLLSNRLYSVDDSVTVASLSAKDMEDMPLYNNTTPNTSNNYKYTQIGELKSDNQEEISEIHWRVDSKISEITRTSGSAKKNLKFEYDAMGNRVAKHVYAGSVLESSTYYVRDAQGNVMGVYEHKMDAENAVMEYKLIERNIYGSAQVGICKDTVDLNITNASGALTQATYYHARQLNHRQYSLSNHLGNVLTTLGDGKAATDSNSDGVIDYYTAYIISVSDYSPFGVELASRTWSIEEYRNGFNGKEKVNEITGNSSDYDFGARIYDARIGRWLSVDPKAADAPDWSPYRAFFCNPIQNTDPTGMLESTHTDEDGNVIAVFDDGDNGVYKHGKNADGGNPTKYQLLKRTEKNGACSCGGTKMGETEYWDEFINPETGQTLTDHTIQFDKSFDPLISEMHEKAKNMDLKEIASNSKGGQLFDIKKDNVGVGALLNGKYATSRSAGNFLAGYNAESATYYGMGIYFTTFQKLAGALHIEENSGNSLITGQMVSILLFDAYISSDIKKFVPPTYGETNYQYRMSLSGWNFGENK